MKTSGKNQALTQVQLAESRFGRVLLHLLCACQDHKIRWHWCGICREFSRHASA